MATETLNPNADGSFDNPFGLSEGSSRFALVNDGDDDTYMFDESDMSLREAQL